MPARLNPTTIINSARQTIVLFPPLRVKPFGSRWKVNDSRETLSNDIPCATDPPLESSKRTTASEYLKKAFFAKKNPSAPILETLVSPESQDPLQSAQSVLLNDNLPLSDGMAIGGVSADLSELKTDSQYSRFRMDPSQRARVLAAYPLSIPVEKRPQVHPFVESIPNKDTDPVQLKKHVYRTWSRFLWSMDMSIESSSIDPDVVAEERTKLEKWIKSS